MSTFEKLLEKKYSATSHERNLRLLAIAIVQLNPDFMAEIFKDRYVSNNHQGGAVAQLPGVRTIIYGMVTAIGNKLWKILPPLLKSISSIEKFNL